MNIIFFGSPQYSCKVLNALISSKHEVLAVVTQNFKQSKHKKNKDTFVGRFASDNNLKVFRPPNLSNNNFLDIIRAYQADLFIIYAYGKILPIEIMSLATYGTINIHCSILPKWRGAAPIQRALLNDDHETGVTFFKIDQGLDTGEILKHYKYTIHDEDDSLILQTKLSDLASNKLIEILDDDISSLTYQLQDESLVSYAKKIKKEEAVINWNENCRTIFCKIRALVGWPVAETVLFGERLKIWKSSYIENKDEKIMSDAATNGNRTFHSNPGSIVNFTPDALSLAAIDGIVSIEKLQLPGKNIVSARDFYNSNSKLTSKIKSFLNK